MKTLIVYYSLEGNVQWTAEKLASRLGADTLRLVPKAAYPENICQGGFYNQTGVNGT